jgi:glycosyltransferase involved in cell wall biosynthesis
VGSYGGEKVKIGIDARFLTHPQEGGFKSYSENLIRGLCELDTRNEYVLYVDRDPEQLSLPRGTNVRVRCVGSGNAIVREQLTLPKAMEADALDVAHMLCNTSPLKLKTKSVLTIHDIIPCKFKMSGRSLKGKLMQAYWRGIIPLAAKRAEHIITVSQASKAEICTTFRVPTKKVTVIPTGFHPAFRPLAIEREAGQMCARLGLTGRFVMGFASSDPRKNVAVFLSAMARVQRATPDCRAVIVCSSEAVEDQVRMLARGAMEDSALKLVSGLSREDLVILYNLAEVVLFPSLYEGFGLPVVEAMACGIPVVTSNVSSLPEVAGDVGVLINPKDPVEAADAVIKLLADPKLRKQKSRQGIAWAQNFQWQRVVQSTIEVYELVVTGQAKTYSPASHTLGGEAG